MNPVGFSGGLWLCSNPNVVSLEIILKNNRMFHCMAYYSNLNIECFLPFCMVIP